MDARLRFVARLLEGEAMTDVCREFGVLRKTGYKIFSPVQGAWARGADRSLAPAGAIRQPVGAGDPATHRRWESARAHWGARKVRELLVRRLDQDFRIPAKSTIHAVLHRHGLVKPLGRPRQRETGNAAFGGSDPKWALVRRFQRRVQAGRRALLLPADRHRTWPPGLHLLLCEAILKFYLLRLRHHRVRAAFPGARPTGGRSDPDNGVPFASPNALFNLSLERLRPCGSGSGLAILLTQVGKSPGQNGRHERRPTPTLRKEATRPPGMNSLQQIACFDEVVKEFNERKDRTRPST